MAKRAKKTLVAINKGKRSHVVGGVLLYPGSNKISKKDLEQINSEIKKLEAEEREETVDMLRKELDLDNVIEAENMKNGHLKYDVENLNRSELKDIIKELWNETELLDLQASIEAVDKMSDSLQKAIDKRLEFLRETPESK